MAKKRIVRFLTVVLFLIVLCSVWILAQNGPARKNAGAVQQPLVLRGGLLIDGTGGTPLENPVIVISGGKIQSVGGEGAVTIPPGAAVIDTSGKTILPGLVDSHIHFRNFHAPAYLYWGV